jgi:hypothetical protein
VEAKKITKHVYNARRVDLEHKLKDIQAQIVEAYNTNGASLGKANPDETGTAWNNLHDREHEINEEIRDLDREWETRNWTTADYQAYHLICENID